MLVRIRKIRGCIVGAFGEQWGVGLGDIVEICIIADMDGYRGHKDGSISLRLRLSMVSAMQLRCLSCASASASSLSS